MKTIRESSWLKQMILIVVVSLAACEKSPKGPVPHDPEKRLFGSTFLCYQEATNRIAELGKPAYGSDDYTKRNNYNLDPATGEYRYDIWLGPHLFSLPENAVFASAARKGVPGIQEVLMLFIPSARSVQAKENRIAFRNQTIQDVPPVMRVRLSCVKGRTFKSEFETHITRRKAINATDGMNLILNEDLGLYEVDARMMEGFYVDANDNFRMPSGGFYSIACDVRYPPLHDIRAADCFMGFLYKYELLVDINFPEVYLPLWRELLLNLLNLLDSSYREY